MNEHAERRAARIAVAALGPGLDASIDSRFGRCACFLIVDAETMAFELLENPVSMGISRAGIAAATRLIDARVTIAITRSMGPRVRDLLQSAGIEVYSFEEGTVRQAILAWRRGGLRRLNTVQQTITRAECDDSAGGP